MRVSASQRGAVQSQFLRWEMFDTDAVNMKAMFKGVNIVKGLKDSVNSKELMCKGEVNLNDVCVCHPGETVDRWFPMGSEDWSADDGPVSPAPLLNVDLFSMSL